MHLPTDDTPKHKSWKNPCILSIGYSRWTPPALYIYIYTLDFVSKQQNPKLFSCWFWWKVQTFTWIWVPYVVALMTSLPSSSPHSSMIQQCMLFSGNNNSQIFRCLVEKLSGSWHLCPKGMISVAWPWLFLMMKGLQSYINFIGIHRSPWLRNCTLQSGREQYPQNDQKSYSKSYMPVKSKRCDRSAIINLVIITPNIQ